MKVKLALIIEGMEFSNDEIRAYYDPKNNELKYFGDYMDLDEEEREEEEYNDDLIGLPDHYDINEYSMMEEFVEGIEDPKDYNCMAIAIQGRGAFRRFKDMAINLGLIEDWYKFRDEKYKEIAREWCENHNINYVE
ncbi:MAG: hypothetical protein IKO38_09190 [Erysipelotrichaceae bacterium]|nr:hypothetical protein [Erysipelotrichaceae bacterium]